MDEPLLEIDEIQANIIPGFRFPFQYLLAIRIAESDSARLLIRELLPQITTAREAIEFHDVRLEKAGRAYRFSLESFKAVESRPVWVNLGIGNRLLESFGQSAALNADQSFKLGLDKRSFTLGDPRDPVNAGHKANWLVGGLHNPADMLIILGSSSQTLLLERVESLLRLCESHDGEAIYQESGTRLGGDKEHFGFRDGVSQPAVRGLISQDPPRYLSRRRFVNSASGPEFASPGDELVWPGEFLFGYPTQSPNNFRSPIPVQTVDPFLRNGSFLVFRRLKQDVKTFRAETERMCLELAANPGFSHFTPDLFRAQLVGRWPDGSPLVRYPDAPPDSTPSEDEINYFRFGFSVPDTVLSDSTAVKGAEGDMDGMRCPFHAHIRKINPRDRETDLGAETNTQNLRILRRGIPFGSPYDEAPEDDNRGLLFISYQTSIRDQFEQLQIDWANSITNPEPGHEEGFDMIIGQNGSVAAQRRRNVIPKDAQGNPVELSTLADWVVPTGGGYFYCPSMNSLRGLAGQV